MADQELTDYERKRLDKIRRNVEMVATLKLHSMATQLSASTKRHSNRATTKSDKESAQKKPKTEAPVVMRRSLRTRGMPPEVEGLLVKSAAKNPKPLTPPKPRAKPAESAAKIHKPLTTTAKPGAPCPLNIKDESSQALIKTLVGVGKNSGVHSSVGVEFGSVKAWEDTISKNLVKREDIDRGSCLKLSSLTLNPENVAQLMPGRITEVQFLPCSNSRMIVAGNISGYIVFWNLDSNGEEEDGIYLYHPHWGPITGISVQQHCLSKIFTGCYEGVVQLMDAEKQGCGGLNILDKRTGNCPTKWSLHGDRINTIDFNPGNPNIMATSSSDRTASIWDLRNINADKPKTLKTVSHERAVQSAYFSSYGRSLATTSSDKNIGITSGVNFEETSVICLDNDTGRWNTYFRAIWGWDESCVFIGTMKRGVDIICPVQRKSVLTLRSPHISAVPCRFDAHPYNVGMLAGATGGGKAYVWTLGQGI